MSHRRPIIGLRKAKRVMAPPSRQPVESTSTAEPVEMLSKEMVPFTQVTREDWSPTIPSDEALGKRVLAKPEFVPASQPDKEDDNLPQDQGGTDEDYERQLAVAQLEIEELRSTLKRERDRSSFVGRLFEPRIYKDEGTQVDRETAEQGVQVE
ncbi:hypothetical protein BGZ54_009842, partial [Gamsiella multidivaricata]